jgi:hypothetical protein
MNRLTCLAFLWAWSSLAADVQHPALEFSFQPPPDHQSQGTDPSTPGLLYRFTRGELGSESFGIFEIHSLGGTLARGSRINKDIAEAAARKGAAKTGTSLSRFEYRTVQWGSMELEVMMAIASANGSEVLSLATQVPLEKEAIQMMLVGPAQERERLVSEFEGVVGSLRGQPSDDNAARDRRLGAMVGVAIFPVMALIIWVISRRRSPFL